MLSCTDYCLCGGVLVTSVLCVDEVDNLDDGTMRLLFEWPRLEGSTLVVIGACYVHGTAGSPFMMTK